MEPEDVLTKEEIETLLDEADDVAGSSARSGPREVEPYDLFNPPGAKPRVSPRLLALTERMADTLTTALAELLSTELELTHKTPQMVAYEEALAALEPPGVFCVLALPPLAGSAMVTINAAAIDGCVDALFGGTGRPFDLTSRSFSAAEQRIAEKLALRVVTSLAASGAPLTEMTPGEVRLETDPDYVGLTGQREPVVVTRMDVQFGAGQTGLLHLIMPDAMFEPVRDALDITKQTAGGDDPAWRSSIRRTVGQADVELCGRFVGVHLTLRDVLRLTAGDFIPIDSAEELTLYAGELPVLRGALGTHAGRHAVRITAGPETQESTVH